MKSHGMKCLVLCCSTLAATPSQFYPSEGIFVGLLLSFTFDTKRYGSFSQEEEAGLMIQSRTNLNKLYELKNLKPCSESDKLYNIFYTS